MSKLLPCPFCDGEDIKVGSRILEYGTDIYICCNTCGAKVQICEEYGMEELEKRWNTRPPIKTGDDSITFAIKDRNGNYYTGYSTWSNQLRKAKLYNSYKWAKEIRDDVRFIERDTFIIKVRTTELDECFYED